MSLDFTARKTCIERMKKCGAFVRLVGGLVQILQAFSEKRQTQLKMSRTKHRSDSVKLPKLHIQLHFVGQIHVTHRQVTQSHFFSSRCLILPWD